MDKQRLSTRQRAIMDFINRFSDENGFPPTIREIGLAVNIPSTSVVNYNLNKLDKEGFITRSKKSSRGIRVIDDNGGLLSGFLMCAYVRTYFHVLASPPCV